MEAFAAEGGSVEDAGFAVPSWDVVGGEAAAVPAPPSSRCARSSVSDRRMARRDLWEEKKRLEIARHGGRSRAGEYSF